MSCTCICTCTCTCRGGWGTGSCDHLSTSGCQKGEERGSWGQWVLEISFFLTSSQFCLSPEVTSKEVTRGVGMPSKHSSRHWFCCTAKPNNLQMLLVSWLRICLCEPVLLILRQGSAPTGNIPRCCCLEEGRGWAWQCYLSWAKEGSGLDLTVCVIL